MKLSDNTLEIMKNFSQINANLFIEKDTNLLRTVALSKNIFAEVEVAETFPENVGILNLHKLLQTISMFDDPDFQFNDSHILITEATGRNTFTYYYTDPSCLTYPKASVKDFPTPVSFILNESTIEQIIKASKVTQLPDIKIKYDANVVSLELKDCQNPTSNVFSFQADGEGDTSLEAFMKVENLKLVAGDYKFFISDRASRLKNVTKSSEPETAADIKSTIKKKSKAASVKRNIGVPYPTLQYCIAMDLSNV